MSDKSDILGSEGRRKSCVELMGKMNAWIRSLIFLFAKVVTSFIYFSRIW